MAEANAPDLRVVGAEEGDQGDLIGEYLATLGGRSVSTVDAYGRILRSLAGWVAERPGGSAGFRPDLFTRAAVETYLKELEARGYSVSHRSRVKSVAGGFAGWLIEEKGLLRKNPTRGVEVPAQALLAPRRLSSDQRYVLKNLVERDGKVRSEALFSLGYWAGCRVSAASWLTAENAHVGPKVGWIRVGHKGGKTRDIDLLNEVRRPLREHLLGRGGGPGGGPVGPYVFASQRSERLTEAGIHHWLRTLKKRPPRTSGSSSRTSPSTTSATTSPTAPGPPGGPWRRSPTTWGTPRRRGRRRSRPPRATRRSPARRSRRNSRP